MPTCLQGSRVRNVSTKLRQSVACLSLSLLFVDLWGHGIIHIVAISDVLWDISYLDVPSFSTLCLPSYQSSNFFSFGEGQAGCVIIRRDESQARFYAPDIWDDPELNIKFLN